MEQFTETAYKLMLSYAPIEIVGYERVLGCADLIHTVLFPLTSSNNVSMVNELKDVNGKIKCYKHGSSDEIRGYAAATEMSEYKNRLAYKLLNDALVTSLSHRPLSTVIFYDDGCACCADGMKDVLKQYSNNVIMSVAGETGPYVFNKENRGKLKKCGGKSKNDGGKSKKDGAPTATVQTYEHCMMLMGALYAKCVQNVRKTEEYTVMKKISVMQKTKLLGGKIKLKLNKSRVVVDDPKEEEDFDSDENDYEQSIDLNMVPSDEQFLLSAIHGTMAPDLSTAAGNERDERNQRKLFTKYSKSLESAQTKQLRESQERQRLEDAKKKLAESNYLKIAPLCFVFVGYDSNIMRGLIRYLERHHPSNPYDWTVEEMGYAAPLVPGPAMTDSEVEVLTALVESNDHMKQFARNIMRESNNLRRSHLLLKKHPHARRRLFVFMTHSGKLEDDKHGNTVIVRRNGNHSVNAWTGDETKQQLSPYVIKSSETISVPRYYSVCMFPKEIAQSIFRYHIDTVLIENSATVYDVSAFALFNMQLNHLYTYNVPNFIKKLDNRAIPVIKEWLAALKSEYLSLFASTVLDLS